MDHAAKEMPNQEKQRRFVIGVGGGGGVVVWGGVAVVAALVVASYSAIKSMKRRVYDKTSATMNEIKGNGVAETKNNASNIEIIGKMRQDKANDENESLARNEEQNDDNIIMDHTTQKDHLPAPDEVTARGTEQKEAIKVVPNTPHVEADQKEQFKREQDYKHRDIVPKRDDELAEEIEVETPRTMDSENEEDSDENSSVSEDERDRQHMRNEQDNVHGREEESSNTSEEEDDDDEEDSEESSEGTYDSSTESNIDAIWPTETMDDMLVESTKRKIDNLISEEKTDNYIKMETEEKGDKNDSSVTNLHKIEDFGESIISSSKRCIKELPPRSSNASVWVWGTLILALALASPLVLFPGGIMKLALAIFFLVGLYRAVDTII